MYRQLSKFLGTDYAALIADAENELAAGEWAAFDAAIVALNDYLIDGAYLIPVYEY